MGKCASWIGESTQNVSEKDVLEPVSGKFKVHLEGENTIEAAVSSDRRRQLQGETLKWSIFQVKSEASRKPLAEQVWMKDHWKKMKSKRTCWKESQSEPSYAELQQNTANEIHEP